MSSAEAAPVRVGVDGRSLRGSAANRGVSRYVRRLLPALARAFPADDYVVLVPGGDAVDASELAAAGIELRSAGMGSRPLFAAAALTGRPRLDRLLGGCDVVFVPAVAPLAVSAGVPVVLTLHDLTFEHRTEDFSAYARAWHRAARPRRLARRAARVITHSETIRNEICAEWELPAERVVSIASGPGKPPGEPGTLPAQLTEPYILAVGALEPRKRPDLLVEAHELARSEGLRAELVFAGDGPLREQLKGGRARLLGYVPDPVLEALYRNALALACVSREEGFGFTPLEALARGTPAVVSDLGVFAETMADGALRVPPNDAGALAEALLRLEREPGLRTRLVASAAGALARLSWEQAALATGRVLREAAAHPQRASTQSVEAI